MANISRNLHLAPALRPQPFGQAAQDFLHQADPTTTPFWILFGYSAERKDWLSSYNLADCPQIGSFKRSAQEFTRIAQMVAWEQWPELFRRILNG